MLGSKERRKIHQRCRVFLIQSEHRISTEKFQHEQKDGDGCKKRRIAFFAALVFPRTLSGTFFSKYLLFIQTDVGLRSTHDLCELYFNTASLAFTVHRSVSPLKLACPYLVVASRQANSLQIAWQCNERVGVSFPGSWLLWRAQELLQTNFVHNEDYLSSRRNREYSFTDIAVVLWLTVMYRAWVVSGHIGLPVNVRYMSGWLGCLEMETISFIFCRTYRSLPNYVERQMSQHPDRAFFAS